MSTTKNLQEIIVKHADLVRDAVVGNAEEIAKAIQMIATAYEEERTVFVAGNGGSMATAIHMQADAQRTSMGRENLYPQKPFRLITLGDNLAQLTALANDNGYENIFAPEIHNLGREGDLLILITGSGNSPNIVGAARVARNKGMQVLAFLGFDGGKLFQERELWDHCVLIRSSDYGVIEDTHAQILLHILVKVLKPIVR